MFSYVLFEHKYGRDSKIIFWFLFKCDKTFRDDIIEISSGKIKLKFRKRNYANEFIIYLLKTHYSWLIDWFAYHTPDSFSLVAGVVSWNFFISRKSSFDLDWVTPNWIRYFIMMHLELI